jgi:putative ABC transport system permease protein
MTERIFSVMTMFFGAVAVMTLALGGIGVMNIMLVSVTERTREIGVRMAIGAKRNDISSQFFTEAAALTIVSGVLGLTLGVGICVLLQLVELPDFIPRPEISVLAVVASLLTLSIITVCAGMYPASRAASLNPIECLRSE